MRELFKTMTLFLVLMALLFSITLVNVPSNLSTTTGLAVVQRGFVSFIPFFTLLMGILAYASFHYYRISK